jgi:predicted DCC family thiol-disulfide oxidoreductase YuxK
MQENKNIVFYDGVCSFCNGLVIFLLKHEKRNNMSFCSLQSEFAKSFLKDFNIQVNLDTIYYYSNGKLYDRSEAIQKITRNLKPPYLLVSYFLVISPKFISEYFYKFFAKNRYKWFGKEDDCKIPSPEDRLRFLDI